MQLSRNPNKAISLIVNTVNIFKKGSTRLRRLLIKAVEGICKGYIDHKYKELCARQKRQSTVVIAYANKANIRLRSRYYKKSAMEKMLQ